MKRRTWIILLTVLMLLQVRGYYIRNLKVDDEFLEYIVEKTIYLENKRLNDIEHTVLDDFDTQDELMTGDMKNKSMLESDMSISVKYMSRQLMEYYRAVGSEDEEIASEHMEIYMEELSRLEALLGGLRKHVGVEELWEKGIFKDS